MKNIFIHELEDIDFDLYLGDSSCEFLLQVDLLAIIVRFRNAEHFFFSMKFIDFFLQRFSYLSFRLSIAIIIIMFIFFTFWITRIDFTIELLCPQKVLVFYAFSKKKKKFWKMNFLRFLVLWNMILVKRNKSSLWEKSK